GAGNASMKPKFSLALAAEPWPSGQPKIGQIVRFANFRGPGRRWARAGPTAIDLTGGTAYKRAHVRPASSGAFSHCAFGRPDQLLFTRNRSKKGRTPRYQKNEAHLPTLEACPQAQAWIPCPDG